MVARKRVSLHRVCAHLIETVIFTKLEEVVLCPNKEYWTVEFAGGFVRLRNDQLLVECSGSLSQLFAVEVTGVLQQLGNTLQSRIPATQGMEICLDLDEVHVGAEEQDEV